MNYKGLMDGWHGDENECDGDCKKCETCQEKYWQRCDQDYDQWREEQLYGT